MLHTHSNCSTVNKLWMDDIPSLRFLAIVQSLKILEHQMIRARVWSDCHQYEADFDATPWFEQASPEALMALAGCDFGMDYPADEVAYFMAEKDDRVADLFGFLARVQIQPFSGEPNGFECQVDIDDARAWIREHNDVLWGAIC
jgi:hypothetical protein